MLPRSKGYTLLELLIVAAVLAVLLTIGFSTYRKARLQAEVRDNRATIASALRDARSNAQRYNVNARVRFLTDLKFALEVKDRLGNTYQKYTRELSKNLDFHYSKDGSHWKRVTTLKEITYTAPFGETDASPTLLRVRHHKYPEIAACLRIVGVTGKVVVAHACP